VYKETMSETKWKLNQVFGEDPTSVNEGKSHGSKKFLFINLV
jgi:hypothetical protein